MNHSLQILASLLILTTFNAPSQAELRLSGIFGDHMVLQREKPVNIWGWAGVGQKVTVDFAGQTVSGTAKGGGIWVIALNPLKASGKGRDLTVSCKRESKIVRDVLVGDVWHASGQSNMAMTVSAVARLLPEAKQHIAAANHSAIRFRRISENQSATPKDDLPTGSGWIVCSPSSAHRFSAAAFYFARELNAELGVPIGVIDTSRGGTPIEPYIPRAVMKSHRTLRREMDLGDMEDLRGIWKLKGGVRARDANWLPSRLFHSRLDPITRFAARGLIWYQGESNCGVGEDPRDYQYKMRALINGWRGAIGGKEMPVYFVQLPGSGARDGWPYLREEQRLSTDLPHTGMVVTIDLLDQDIHPPNKIDVGQRLARWALADEYGKSVPYSGPMFAGFEVSDGKVTVSFSHAESGLMVATKAGLADPKEAAVKELSHFELADKRGEWRAAEAIVRGKTVVVHSDAVSAPVAVRYGYANDPQHCNLYNRDGLPASPFVSDLKWVKFDPGLPKD